MKIDTRRLLNNRVVDRFTVSATDMLIDLGTAKLKETFGVDMRWMNEATFSYTVKTLEQITGTQIFSTQQATWFPHTTFCKVVKVDLRTYVFVYWGPGQNEDKDREGYIYLFGKNSYRLSKKLDEDRNHSEYTKQTRVYTICGVDGEANEWEGIRKAVASRPFNTLYLDDDLENKITSHLDNWLKNKEIYRLRGITFKTGILLHGTPGTGKSSLAAAIADYLDCDLIVIDSATFSNLNLTSVSATINADSQMYVVLLDDIDVILTSRTDEKATTTDKANVAKLLGFLDSSNSPDNVVFVATTNHVELLDDAVKRSGRFDKVFQVGNLTNQTAIRMCEGFGLNAETSKEVVSKFPDNNVNPADLQVEIVETIKTNLSEASEGKNE